MACRWDYQRDHQQWYKQGWDRDNRSHLRKYRAVYREKNPEETRQQRLNDWRRFAQKNPERWREIHRAANQRYSARQKALKQAQRNLARKGEV